MVNSRSGLTTKAQRHKGKRGISRLLNSLSSYLSYLCAFVVSPLPPSCLCGESLTPDELRVERPRLGDVVGPLDDRAAVGEDGELVALGGEPEHERVVPDVAQRGE